KVRVACRPVRMFPAAAFALLCGPTANLILGRRAPEPTGPPPPPPPPPPSPPPPPPPPPPYVPVPPYPPHPANDASVSMPITAVRTRILNPPQLAGLRELDFSQLTNRKPPGASNFGSPGPGRICSCSSSILFLEQL